MTDIDEIVRAHEQDENAAAINCDLHTRRILDRESALIAKVREMEKEIEFIRNGAAFELSELEKDKAGLVEKYNDLIMCVSKKYPGESRHDTAKRYLLDRERFSIGESQAKQRGGEKA